jgi:epoxyqueuosine reductase
MAEVVKAVPEIRFIPASTDPRKIRFFGTLMPALLLLIKAPHKAIYYFFKRFLMPRSSVEDYIRKEADDSARIDDTMIFIHRWRSEDFDPVAFAKAHVFLSQLTRLMRKSGYNATPLDPLSPDTNLPKLAAKAGLGNLSPFGLLVHPEFGPRVIISGIHAGYPLDNSPRRNGKGCIDCRLCLKKCPQEPLKDGSIDLGSCHSCARCISVCPVGKR